MTIRRSQVNAQLLNEWSWQPKKTINPFFIKKVKNKKEERKKEREGWMDEEGGENQKTVANRNYEKLL